MGAGYSKRGSFGPMAERVARARGEDVAPGPTPGIKHCWVDTGNGRQPGLLLDWRQRPDGWYGRVVHPARTEDGWHVVEEWLPAGLLDSAG